MPAGYSMVQLRADEEQREWWQTCTLADFASLRAMRVPAHFSGVQHERLSTAQLEQLGDALNGDCPICMSRCQDVNEGVVIILECGAGRHAFPEACLARHVSTVEAQGGMAACPTCRSHIGLTVLKRRQLTAATESAAICVQNDAAHVAESAAAGCVGCYASGTARATWAKGTTAAHDWRSGGVVGD